MDIAVANARVEEIIPFVGRRDHSGVVMEIKFFRDVLLAIAAGEGDARQLAFVAVQTRQTWLDRAMDVQPLLVVPDNFNLSHVELRAKRISELNQGGEYAATILEDELGLDVLCAIASGLGDAVALANAAIKTRPSSQVEMHLPA